MMGLVGDVLDVVTHDWFEGPVVDWDVWQLHPVSSGIVGTWRTSAGRLIGANVLGAAMVMGAVAFGITSFGINVLKRAIIQPNDPLGVATDIAELGEDVTWIMGDWLGDWESITWASKSLFGVRAGDP